MIAALAERLAAELARLYLAPGAVAPHALAAHLLGQQLVTVSLVTTDGQVRALALPFERSREDGEDGHWQRLCAVANAMQGELGLPAPAVSIDGEKGYRLWLSFAAPVPASDVARLLDGLRAAGMPQLDLATAAAPVALPPCLHPRTGKWAAFVHPGMGGSFAEEPGLDMQPPLTGQVTFLEGLESIAPEQLRHALKTLDGLRTTPHATPAPAPAMTNGGAGLLLRDATLEDIVAHLQAKGIEPTFRFLAPK